MNIIGFIPARSGSKSVPGKNIKMLGGKPLIAWTIECAFKSGLPRVIVNTDGEDIAKVAREYGAEVMMRPEELAQDKTSMFQVLKSEIPKISPLPELVMLLSPTSPLREFVHIKFAQQYLVENLDKYDSLMSVKKVPNQYNPAQVLVTTPLGIRMANGSPLSNRIARRQEYPEAYVTNSGIYFFKTSNLEKGSFYGDNTMMLECDDNIDINSLEDFEEAELCLKSLRK